MRYADDFVILARYQGDRISDWIEDTIEGWMSLTINREKTKIVKLNTPGSTLEFLGYSFVYRKDKGKANSRRLRLSASKGSIQRSKAKIRELTSTRFNCLPVATVVGRLNRQLIGWSNYYKLGYRRESFRKIDYHVYTRMVKHLWRRSQRGYRRVDERSRYELIYKHLKVVRINAKGYVNA